METFNTNDMTRGWFVGDFEPSALKTDQFEVALQSYKAGDKELAHIHKIATEITVMAEGEAKINGVLLKEGMGTTIKPGQVAIFEAITDCKTLVVKTPSAPNDKYLINE